jgi:membrane protein required for colicin V production
MNWIDLIIVILIVLSVISGFSNGLVKEVASLAGLILGIWGAIKFSSFTAMKLNEWFDMTGQYIGIIAFVITFCAIVIIIHFIGVLADKVVDAVSLGFLNRLLGMVFGAIKNILILSVIFSVLNAIDARRHFLPESVGESKFYQPISDIVPSIFPVIGEGNFKQSFDRFKKEPPAVPAQDTTEVAI